jgi:hypothetical protein
VHIRNWRYAKYPNICWRLIWNGKCMLFGPSEVQNFGMGPKPTVRGKFRKQG